MRLILVKSELKVLKLKFLNSTKSTYLWHLGLNILKEHNNTIIITTTIPSTEMQKPAIVIRITA